MTEDVVIPEIGDFADVEIVEIPVAVGDTVTKDDPIMMLESDKATLDIPAPFAGKVTEILVAEGDRVSAGSVVMRFAVSTTTSPAKQTAPAEQTQTAPLPPADSHTQLLVIGAGPGGYTAAFRAADLGLSVTMVDPRQTLGGVCLNVGCIPSKALLHLAKVRDDTAAAAAHGLSHGEAIVDLDKIRNFKASVVGKLTGGLTGLAKKRKVNVIRGTANFTGPHSAEITKDGSFQSLTFDWAIVAVGSTPVKLPFLPEDPRIIDSTGALELTDIPNRLLVIGGGIIGLEMAQVYTALGSNVEIVEMADQIMPGADADIVKPLSKHIAKIYKGVRTGTKVTSVDPGAELTVTFENESGTETAVYDRILVAVGRSPNGHKVTPEAAGLTPDAPGFLPVNEEMRTQTPHIFAIGDVVGQPMLAHKAVHEGKVAAEVIAGHKVAFEPKCIPSVAYTDPEVAWVGLTQTDAKAKGIKVKTASFPWMASGRALSLDRDEGITKLILDPETGTVLGAGIVGPNAGELIAEAALAIEMSATAEDIGLTIHPHPTLSETVALSAEIFSGTITDL